MEKMIVRVFDEFECAEQAREALLAAGFDRSDVEFSVRRDEAGGTQGNFTVGDHTRDDEPVYERKFAHARVVGGSVLTVTAHDEAAAQRAAAIMQRYGAADPDRSAPA